MSPSLFDMPKRQHIAPISDRDSNKMNIERELAELFMSDKKYCGDDVALVVSALFEKKFGEKITKEQISFIGTAIRSRCKVLNDHPHLDIRTATLKRLEKEDKEYYSERN